MFKGITLKGFRARFATNNDCMMYLVEQKWGNGYSCTKCGHGRYGKGRQLFYRRWHSCGYDESVTAHTLFHWCKLMRIACSAFISLLRLAWRSLSFSSVSTLICMMCALLWYKCAYRAIRCASRFYLTLAFGGVARVPWGEVYQQKASPKSAQYENIVQMKLTHNGKQGFGGKQYSLGVWFS